MSEAAALLWHEIERTNAFHAGPGADAELAPKLQVLAAWQAQRLARTYADLRETPRYRPATEFFLSDLYGGKDFTQRDRDVERLYPVVVRVLSEHAVETIALAMELNVMSHELDQRLVEALPARGGQIGRITEASYCQAYRRCDNYAERRHQIALIRRIGEELDAVVAKPMLYTALKLGRKPAQLAGLDELQGFLERGFRAYRDMGGAKEFLDTIESREVLILDQIYAGKPDPFNMGGG
jgi:hypothetical protein